ncbi:hypothetical protein [Streptomyces sp. NPDC002133]|uniref:hypothetical protein n=1 Tax=Streptomyces sp. NPDC002133 TaxID=3154409 RepID=UPI00332AB348
MTAASEGPLSGARSSAVYALLLGLGVLDAAGYSPIAPVLPTPARQTGAGTSVPVWVGAPAVAGSGIGMANTGSVGVPLDAVPAQRIVTAMVLWSQIGILGYLLAPAPGGPIADAYGYAAVAVVVAVSALVVPLTLGRRSRP